jgi:uncharacterized phage protein (TIGR02218 family)
MRPVPPGLAAHLASGETTLAQCWRILRRDGVVLGFTDHDQVLTVAGTPCRPTSGLDGATVPARLGAQVETGEVLGLLDDAAIGEEDILLARYDGATVESWLVNWRVPGEVLRLRVDTIGEIVREDGVFRAELRSPQQALNLTVGRLYQGLCDVALGSARCGVNLALPAYRGTAAVVRVDDPFRLVVSGLGSFAPGWFGLGSVHWTAGRRIGLDDALLTHERTAEGDVLGFAEKVGEWLAPGDGLVVTAGCDRRLATCRDRFANATNFRGFPHVPGNDYVLRHPRAGEALDGRAVVK